MNTHRIIGFMTVVSEYVIFYLRLLEKGKVDKRHSTKQDTHNKKITGKLDKRARFQL